MDGRTSFLIRPAPPRPAPPRLASLDDSYLVQALHFDAVEEEKNENFGLGRDIRFLIAMPSLGEKSKKSDIEIKSPFGFEEKGEGRTDEESFLWDRRSRYISLSDYLFPFFAFSFVFGCRFSPCFASSAMRRGVAQFQAQLMREKEMIFLYCATENGNAVSEIRLSPLEL
ncbi:hypothetical protein ACLOJK_018455 [Asimina triloba]